MYDKLIHKLIGWYGQIGFGQRKWTAGSYTASAGDEHTAFVTKMAPVLDEFETIRADTYRTVMARAKWMVPTAIVASIVGFAVLPVSEAGDGSLFILFGPLVLAMTAAAHGPSTAYRSAFKAQVIPHFFTRFGLDGYTTTPRIHAQALETSGIWNQAITCKTEDEFSGLYRGHSVALAELRIDASDKDSTTEIFNGILMEFELPREVTGRTVIVPAAWSSEPAKSGLFNTVFGRPVVGLQPVVLESPGFNAKYAVKSDDQVGARVLLSPAFMERLMQLNTGITSREFESMGRFQKSFVRSLVAASANATVKAALPKDAHVLEFLQTAKAASRGDAQVVAIAENGRLLIAVPKSENIDYFEPPPYHVAIEPEAVLMQLSVDIQNALDVADAIFDLDYRTRHAPTGLRLVTEVNAA